MTSKKIIRISIFVAMFLVFLFLAGFALLYIAPPHPDIVIF